MSLILLLSNDVRPNLRSVRCPCSVCYQLVRVNQRALQCDACVYWCHCTCCGVDCCSYVAYQNAVEFNWLCPRCITDVMPFHDCSTLSSSSRCTSVSCSSLSTSCDSSFIYDLPVLSSLASL